MANGDLPGHIALVLLALLLAFWGRNLHDQPEDGIIDDDERQPDLGSGTDTKGRTQPAPAPAVVGPELPAPTPMETSIMAGQAGATGEGNHDDRID